MGSEFGRWIDRSRSAFDKNWCVSFYIKCLGWAAFCINVVGYIFILGRLLYCLQDLLFRSRSHCLGNIIYNSNMKLYINSTYCMFDCTHKSIADEVGISLQIHLWAGPCFDWIVPPNVYVFVFLAFMESLHLQMEPVVMYCTVYSTVGRMTQAQASQGNTERCQAMIISTLSAPGSQHQNTPVWLPNSGQIIRQ